jgi:hypothetical protein
MQFGFVMPIGSARNAADLAFEAEKAGWDGFFVWELVWGVDAWISLAAAAMRTKRIRLGTMLSPLSRMRPWKVASETVTLDHLSNGRLILSVGLGAIDNGFEQFGEVTDRKTRAELLDEGLDVLTGLWHGQPFKYDGKHYKIKPTEFYPPPPPVQKPRIPIWVVGAWPRTKSMNRVLHYDGLLPNVFGKDGRMGRPEPKDVREMRLWIEKHGRAKAKFDIIVEGRSPGGDPVKAGETVRPWVEAGATWWTETMWNAMDDTDVIQKAMKRIRQGPPRMESNSKHRKLSLTCFVP